MRAKATAIGALVKFLREEEVKEEQLRKRIDSDESRNLFVCVMEKFGMYLAFKDGRKDKPIARNTAMQYYRQAKLWVLNAGKTLDSFCLKQDGGGFVAKAPP
ncbi:hypothetical protein PI125_g8209 [Phytophthora idaei]|nr:hypothetical protein PI125_g8209 [Phytophthora idaei]